MKRAVRNIICLLAAGLIVFGLMEAGLEFSRHRLGKTDAKKWHYVVGGGLAVFGAVLFAASSRIAAQLTDDDDDDQPSLPPSDS